MVSTSARNAGGPCFDSRSQHDQLLYDNSVYIYMYLYIQKIMTSEFLHYLITATGFVILIRWI